MLVKKKKKNFSNNDTVTSGENVDLMTQQARL